MQPSALVEFLDGLRRDGTSIKTANDYLAAVKGFTRWLWRDHGVSTDVHDLVERSFNGQKAK